MPVRARTRAIWRYRCILPTMWARYPGEAATGAVSAQAEPGEQRLDLGVAAAQLPVAAQRLGAVPTAQQHRAEPSPRGPVPPAVLIDRKSVVEGRRGGAAR